MGPSAVLLRCGQLSNTGTLEALAVISLKSIPNGNECTPASRIVILRQEKSGWKAALTAAKEVKNPEGYIGLDYIDDTYTFLGHCLHIADKRSDGSPAFTIFLTYLRNRRGETEGSSTEISWNSQAGRYQEFAGEFLPEVKNLPHRSPAKSK